MLIERVNYLEEYKGIKAGTEIVFKDIEKYQVLVGLNGSGKSRIIDTLYYAFYNTYNSNIRSIDPFLPKNILINGFDNKNYSNYNTNIKYIFYNYSGETLRYISQTAIYRYKKGVQCMLFDCFSWDLACFILQLLNDDDNRVNKWTSNIWNESLDSFLKLVHLRKFGDDEFRSQPLLSLPISDRIDLARKLANKHLQKKDFRQSTHNYLESAHFLNIPYLSEGEKKLLILKMILRISDDNTLILLDEPDANLDIQKKRELYEIIENCKGQVILSTHDPIMTNWMKEHLVFMENGHQISRSIPNAIKELSEGELSYQETLYILSESKHFVFVEGKTDIAFIKKAIEKLGYSKQFENITFLSMGSSGAVEDKYYTTIAELLPKDTKKVLFLFDSDKGGTEGKKQIDLIIEEYNNLTNIQQKLNKKKTDVEKIVDENVKDKINLEIKDLEYQIEKIQKVAFDPNKLLAYYFYNNNDDFDAKDQNKWFYLEDYFPPRLYPEKGQIKISDIQKEYINDTETDIIRFSYLLALDKKYQLAAKQIKDYLKDNLHKFENKEDFVGFRPLLDKILEKLELKK